MGSRVIKIINTNNEWMNEWLSECIQLKAVQSAEHSKEKIKKKSITARGIILLCCNIYITFSVQAIHILCSFVALWRLSYYGYMLAFNLNKKLHIICALSWPSGGHFVCLMTAILVYRLSKIMFDSNMGVYINTLHVCYQNHESASILPPKLFFVFY